MSYFEVEEVGRLIVNFARWRGDGAASVGSSAGIWGRLVRETFRSSQPIVTLGLDAGYTKTALARMRAELRDSLLQFHLSSLGVGAQAMALRVSRDTHHRRLVEAHPLFMQLYGEAVLEAAHRRAAVERVTLAARREGSMEAPAFLEAVRRRRQARKQKP